MSRMTVPRKLLGKSHRSQIARSACSDERIDEQLRRSEHRIDPLSEPLPELRQGNDACRHQALTFAGSRLGGLRRCTATPDGAG
jgi:hypothetical protein